MIQPVQSSSAYVPSTTTQDPNLALRVTCTALAVLGTCFSLAAGPEIALPLSLCFIGSALLIYGIFRSTIEREPLPPSPWIPATPVLVNHSPSPALPPIYMTPIPRQVTIHHEAPRVVIIPPSLSGHGARAPVGLGQATPQERTETPPLHQVAPPPPPRDSAARAPVAVRHTTPPPQPHVETPPLRQVTPPPPPRDSAVRAPVGVRHAAPPPQPPITATVHQPASEPMRAPVYGGGERVVVASPFNGGERAGVGHR